MDVVKDLSGWRVDSGLPHMKLRVVQTSCFFSSLQDGHFPWIIFACAGTPAFLGGTPRSLSITSSSRPPTASTCYPWHGHSIAQTCPAQVSVSAIKAPEQSNQERARPRIRLVGRQLGPLATDIFPGGLQALTGPVKGCTRGYICWRVLRVDLGRNWWLRPEPHVCVCVSLYPPPMANSSPIRNI